EEVTIADCAVDQLLGPAQCALSLFRRTGLRRRGEDALEDVLGTLWQHRRDLLGCRCLPGYIGHALSTNGITCGHCDSMRRRIEFEAQIIPSLHLRFRSADWHPRPIQR